MKQYIKITSVEDYINNGVRPFYRIFKELNPLLELHKDQYSFRINVLKPQSNTLCAETHITLQGLTQGDIGPTQRASLILECRAIAQGIKYYQPTIKECLSLDNVDIKIPGNIYEQPYEVFTINLPSEYKTIFKTIPANMPDLSSVIEPIADNEYTQPQIIFSAFFRKEKVQIIKVLHEDGTVLVLTLDLGSSHTMEEIMRNTIKHKIEQDVENYNPSEINCLEKSWRLISNICLLLTNFGHINAGPRNPQHLRRLQNRLRRQRDPQRNRTLQEEIRLLPQRIKLKETINLYKVHKNTSSHTVRPHWRRGCWVHQPYGKKWSLRKLIFRKPTFVHGELVKEIPLSYLAEYKK